MTRHTRRGRPRRRQTVAGAALDQRNRRRIGPTLRGRRPGFGGLGLGLCQSASFSPHRICGPGRVASAGETVGCRLVGTHSHAGCGVGMGLVQTRRAAGGLAGRLWIVEKGRIRAYEEPGFGVGRVKTCHARITARHPQPTGQQTDLVFALRRADRPVVSEFSSGLAILPGLRTKPRVKPCAVLTLPWNRVEMRQPEGCRSAARCNLCMCKDGTFAPQPKKLTGGAPARKPAKLLTHRRGRPFPHVHGSVTWRKGWDSNPRSRKSRTPDFESGAFNHSATLPLVRCPQHRALTPLRLRQLRHCAWPI